MTLAPELLQILGELGSADRLRWAGEAPLGVAGRKADGFRADIKAREAPACHGSREFSGTGGDQCQAASLRSASCRIAAQNRA